jgi:hypothetical protein
LRSSSAYSLRDQYGLASMKAAAHSSVRACSSLRIWEILSAASFDTAGSFANRVYLQVRYSATADLVAKASAMEGIAM